MKNVLDVLYVWTEKTPFWVDLNLLGKWGSVLTSGRREVPQTVNLEVNKYRLEDKVQYYESLSSPF